MSFPGSWGGGPPWLRAPPGQLGLPAGQGRVSGAREDRVAGARPGVVADSCGRAAGKAGDWCRKGCCWGPARPCDPLYSCHNLGTFGAAPNGAPGRPAPPGNSRPPSTRPARRSPRLERRPGRPWSGSVSGRGSVAWSLVVPGERVAPCVRLERLRGFEGSPCGAGFSFREPAPPLLTVTAAAAFPRSFLPAKPESR